jgi:cytochrome P450 family 135
LGGYHIPAGVILAPSINLVHHSSRYYPEPDAFQPQRFLNRRPDPAVWLPFGGGVRRCLGAGFALMEATAVLGEILRACDVHPDRSRPEPATLRNITLAPGRGATVVVRRREA